MRASSRRSATDNADGAVQFERQGYFCRDPDSTPDRLVFNRTIGLRDTFAKVAAGRGVSAAGLFGVTRSLSALAPR